MKKKAIISAVVTAAIMAAGAVGGTIAYFSTSNETDVNITSGRIGVSSVVSNLATYSFGVAQPAGTFENGGTAILNDHTITLDRMTPGDKATFKIAISVDNNIKIKYRVVFNKTGDLADALVGQVSGGASDWTLVEPSENPTAINLDASIEMPNTVGLEYADKTGSVRIVVEAVQGNMPQSVSTLAQFEEAIESAENGEVSLYLENDIQVNHTIEIPDNAQVNIYGNGETTITTPSNVKRPLILDTIENTTLTISGVNIQGNGNIVQSNGIGFWDTENCTVNLYDVNLQQPDYYALNVGTGNEGLVINVEDSEIQGWCALNVWSEGVTVNVKNSTLRGVNDHDGNSDAFATIVVNSYYAPNATINLENSIVEAIENDVCYESFFSIREAGAVITSTNTTYKYKRSGSSTFETYASIEEVLNYNSLIRCWVAAQNKYLLDEDDDDILICEQVQLAGDAQALEYPFFDSMVFDNTTQVANPTNCHLGQRTALLAAQLAGEGTPYYSIANVLVNGQKVAVCDKTV